MSGWMEGRQGNTIHELRWTPQVEGMECDGAQGHVICGVWVCMKRAYTTRSAGEE